MLLCKGKDLSDSATGDLLCWARGSVELKLLLSAVLISSTAASCGQKCFVLVSAGRT